MAEFLKRYAVDIRELGQASDLFVLIVGGVVFVCGSSLSILDAVVFQQWEWRPGHSALGLACLSLGLCLRIQAMRTLSRYWSPVARVLPDHVLVTRGVYRTIRHPGYLGEILIYLSVPLLLGSGYGLAVMALIVPIILYRIGIEERMLREKFGEEYREYASRTKRLIPYVY